MPVRTRLPIDERRRQLIAAGLELFASRPYADVAMADVARVAGVSHGLAFHYFGDKRGLYLQVLTAVTDQLVTATAPAPGATPLEQLYAGLAAHVDFASRYPQAYTAFLHGGNGTDPDVETIIEQARSRGLIHMLNALAVTRPSPRLEIALRGWQGFTEGAIVAWLRDESLPRAELLDMLAAVLADALRAGGLDRSTIPDKSQ